MRAKWSRRNNVSIAFGREEHGPSRSGWVCYMEAVKRFRVQSAARKTDPLCICYADRPTSRLTVAVLYYKTRAVLNYDAYRRAAPHIHPAGRTFEWYDSSSYIRSNLVLFYLIVSNQGQCRSSAKGTRSSRAAADPDSSRRVLVTPPVFNYGRTKERIN